MNSDNTRTYLLHSSCPRRYARALNELFATATRVESGLEHPQLIRVGFWRDRDTGRIYEVHSQGMRWNGTCAPNDKTAVEVVLAMSRYWDNGNGSAAQMNREPELRDGDTLESRVSRDHNRPTPGR